MFFCQVTSGQHYPFREYTVLDGLPHNQINGFFQDSRGYIWFTTLNGVSRFDGIEFRNYFHKDGLLKNDNLSAFEDEDNHVWIIAASGLSRFNGTRFESFPYVNDKKFEGFTLAKFINDTIFLILKDLQSVPHYRILFFRDGQYHEYSRNFPELADVELSDIFFNKSSYYLLVDDKSRCLIWGNRKLSPLPDIWFSRPSKDFPVLTDGKNEYIFQNDRLISYTPKNGVIRTSGSFYMLNEGNNTTKVEIPSNANPFLDREFDLWYDPEMNIFRLLSTAFKSFTVEDGLPENAWAVAEDRKGHIWFGSLYQSLSEYDGEKFIPREDYKNAVNGKSYFYKGSIMRSNGDVLLSTQSGVLVWNGKAFSKIPGLNGKQICVVYEDPVDKSLFFGTDSGLFHLDKGKMEKFSEFTSKGLGVIEGIARDDSGKYWLSGQRGIVVKDGSVLTAVTDSILPSGYSYTIIKDSRNGIWVSSEEGLFVKPAGSKKFKAGLPAELNSTANVVAEMDDKHIIVGRNHDICIIDIPLFYRGDTVYYKIYDSSCGFPGNDCLDHGIIKDQEGKFWILTSGKVVILDPEKLRTNINPPTLHVTDLSFQTDSLSWKRIDIPELFYERQGILRFTHLQNYLKFNFTGISFKNPEKVTYQYRLIGNSEIWSAKYSSREAVYNDLPPGKYEFQLLGFNADGIRNNEPFKLEFIIVPAFWQTLIFRIFAFIFIAVIIVLTTIIIVRRNIRIRDEQDKIKKELTRLQLNSIIGQFEPHFTFNVISSAGSLILKGEKDKAYDYLVKLSGLLRSVLTDGSLVIRSLEEEMNFVSNYCELQQLRFRDRLSWKINVDKNVNLLRQIPRMTVQTFVENSIKHGFENKAAGGKINISINQINGYLQIEITDDGIGRKAAEKVTGEKSGHGLKTITGIFNFMNKINRENATIEMIDLFDENNKPRGTTIVIRIPDNYIFKSYSAET